VGAHGSGRRTRRQSRGQVSFAASRTWNGVIDDETLLCGIWQGKLPQPLSGQICVLAFANPASNGACLGSDVTESVASKHLYANSRIECMPYRITSMDHPALHLAFASPLTCHALGRKLTGAESITLWKCSHRANVVDQHARWR
jgi:hypothetical protein